jgi:hypothetical protein
MLGFTRLALVLGLLHGPVAGGLRPLPSRRLRSAKMAQPDVTRRADASSERVIDAARKFGLAQAGAAEAWVQLAKVYAVAGKVPSGEALLQQEVGLFTDCLLDGDAEKCKELDSALRELLELLETQGNGDFMIRFTTSVKLKVVAYRVCAAATPFGPAQASADVLCP